MAFDPTKPANNSPISSAELRNQLNALKGLIDGMQAQVSELQTQIGGRALMPTMGEFIHSPHDPPTVDDIYALNGVVNDLLKQLEGVEW